MFKFLNLIYRPTLDGLGQFGPGQAEANAGQVYIRNLS